MNDREETKTDGNTCDCGNRSGKYNWIWTVLALALAVALIGRLARKGPSACAGGFCPFPAAAADSNAAHVGSK